MLENLNVSSEAGGRKIFIGKINFKASTFLKINDGLSFSVQKSTVVTFLQGLMPIF